jgi:hypothetical protein
VEETTKGIPWKMVLPIVLSIGLGLIVSYTIFQHNTMDRNTQDIKMLQLQVADTEQTVKYIRDFLIRRLEAEGS